MTKPNHQITEPSPARLSPDRAGGPASGPVADRPQSAFTLIELLVVISIIGVLAGLIVGLTGLATRKSRESRIRVEMNRLINDIENYKANLGFYPPDHRVQRTDGTEFGWPAPNQLFYELSGTLFTNTDKGQFTAVGRREPMAPTVINSLFGQSGFANAQRDQKDLKFMSELKASQFKRVTTNGVQFDVLAVPVPGPKNSPWLLRAPNSSVPVNPWLYVSTSPTNNPERFDLWTEVLINGKIMRFSNWEKETVVLSP